MTKSLLIKDYMNPNPTTVTPDTCVLEVVKITIRNKVSGLLVIDESKKYLGMISELACLKVMADNLYLDGKSAPSLSAKDLMTVDVTTTSPNDQLFDVLTSMLKLGQRRRPVVDEEGKLVGQVTCRQLLKIISSFAK